MKKLLPLLVLVLLSCQQPGPTSMRARVEAPRATDAAITVLDAGVTFEPEVHFSPSGGCTDMVVRYIEGANTSVYVLAYSFTSGPIGDALLDKVRQGKTVSIVLDKSDVNEKGGLLPEMEQWKVPLLIDRKHAIAHNKTMVIDGKIVLTGSFNFTTAAEKSNAENCLAIQDPVLAAKYMANWNVHHDHSVPPPEVTSIPK